MGISLDFASLSSQGKGVEQGMQMARSNETDAGLMFRVGTVHSSVPEAFSGKSKGIVKTALWLCVRGVAGSLEVRQARGFVARG